MQELLDVMIRLGGAREVGRAETPTGKEPYERSFGGNKLKFAKPKWESKEDPKGSSGKPTMPKAFIKQPKQVDAKDATNNCLCFKCSKVGHITRSCREGETGKIELYWLNSLIKDKGPTFKRKNKMLESLIPKNLVAEGGFKTKLFLINPSINGLVYLKAQVNGANMSMLIDTTATNFFIMSECAKRVKVVVENTALHVNVKCDKLRIA